MPKASACVGRLYHWPLGFVAAASLFLSAFEFVVNPLLVLFAEASGRNLNPFSIFLTFKMNMSPLVLDEFGYD